MGQLCKFAAAVGTGCPTLTSTEVKAVFEVGKDIEIELKQEAQTTLGGSMNALMKQNAEIIVEKNGCEGPTMFELEFLKQLRNELGVFLTGSMCSTLQDIVIGVRGSNYQAIIPLSRSE